MKKIFFTTMLSLSLFSVTTVSFVSCSSKGNSESMSNANYKGNEHYNDGYRLGTHSKNMGDRRMNPKEVASQVNTPYSDAFGAGYNDAFDGKPSQY